jgi:hypothetical protein
LTSRFGGKARGGEAELAVEGSTLGLRAAFCETLLAGLLVVITAFPGAAYARCNIAVDAGEARALADKVWRNESGRDFAKILWWNPGEAFASLGIGHFIWYPAGVDGPFHESFPELLAYVESHGVTLPTWLADPVQDCPWPTREVFLEQRYGEKATQLRKLLIDTVALQAQFMLARLESALDRILATVSTDDAVVIESRFCALAVAPAGRYALVDYVNFKGEGIKPEERYQGQGWGLKQVLQEMRSESPSSEDFAEAAAKVLERRVENAPPERREQRWLPGWLRRVETYRQE